MDIEYRKVMDIDRFQITELMQELHTFHVTYNDGTQNFREHIDNVNEVIDFLYKNDTIFVAVTKDGRIIGFIDFSIESNKEGNYELQETIVKIHNLIVHKEFRNTGIGSQLLEICKNYAKDSGNLKLELGAYAFNETAIKFYQKHGFKVCFVHLQCTQ